MGYRPPPTSGFPGDVVWSCLKDLVLPESVKGRVRMRRGLEALSPTCGVDLGHGHPRAPYTACRIPFPAEQPAQPLCMVNPDTAVIARSIS